MTMTAAAWVKTEEQADDSSTKSDSDANRDSDTDSVGTSERESVRESVRETVDSAQHVLLERVRADRDESVAVAECEQ